MSSEDSKPRFPFLNDTNYVQWSIRIEAELIRKKLWFNIVCVEDEPPDDVKTVEEMVSWRNAKLAKRSKEKMSEARAELILRVEDSQLAHMESRDPWVVWEELKKIHVARGLASRLALRRRWWRMAKEEKEVMSAWIGRVKGAAHQLVKIGVEVSDEDRILVLTSGLDVSYDSFVISLDSTPSDELTLELVVNRLLNEEVRRDNRKEEDSEKAAAAEAKVYAVKGVGFGPGAGAQVCWMCGKPGHMKIACPHRLGMMGGLDKQVAQMAVSARGQGDESQLVDYGGISVGPRMPGYIL